MQLFASGSDLRSQSTSTGLAIIQLTDVLAKVNPNFVVTIADRYETLPRQLLHLIKTFLLYIYKVGISWKY